MSFELDTQTLIVICAAISVVLFAEAVYLLGFSTASYRSNVNRRLKLSKDQPAPEAVLTQLRREVARRDGHHRALGARRPSRAGRGGIGRAGNARSDRHRVRHRGR